MSGDTLCAAHIDRSVANHYGVGSEDSAYSEDGGYESPAPV